MSASAQSAQAEQFGFQTEARQLLKLMIHSLYSNREIFLRELISNASDAIDKLRFLALSQPDLIEGDNDYKIRIDFDEEAGTLTVRDNGIGMNREEVIANLGTIAKSGTAEFLSQLSGDQRERCRADRAVWRGLLQRFHRGGRGRGPNSPCRRECGRRGLLALAWRGQLYAGAGGNGSARD
jgi:hypothetical protein